MQPPVLLLVPAEGRDPVVVAVQDPRLAGRGGRRQERLPAVEVVAAGADPAGEVGDPAGPDLPGQDRLGEAVDLDDDQPGLVGRRHALAAGHHLLHEDGEVGIIAGDREDRRQERVYDRVDERGHQGRDDPAHLEVADEDRQHQERDDLEDEGGDRHGDDRDAGEQGQEHGPDEDVEDAQHDRCQEEAANDRDQAQIIGGLNKNGIQKLGPDLAVFQRLLMEQLQAVSGQVQGQGGHPKRFGPIGLP